ncbi:UNVERIFIED_ORG: quinate dehydrogenase (quinone) [Pseudomonas reinekei]|nr:quinate dehydrogenase (quinone) [Pseudomonas reinekei]
MNNSGAAAGSKWLLAGLGVLIALIGLGLAGGGGYLIALGGSGYFLLMGLAMLVSGLLIARRKPLGAWLYGAALVLTAIWAVWDAGLEYWPLVSRVLTFAVIGLVVALIYPTLVRASGATGGRGAYGLAGILGVGVVATMAYMFIPTHVVKNTTVPAVTPVTPGTEQKDWAHWGNTTAGNRFAALDQINKGNIDKLQVAWTFRTGDIPQSTGAGAEDQNTPLQIGDTVYTCTAYGKVFALDADTGTQRWKFDPQGTAPNWQRCRGLGYSETPASSDNQPTACTKRLFLPTGDARLIAINADTGKPCEEFGNQGTVDLTTDMGEVKPGYYQQTSTPLVAGDVVIVGGRVADNYSTGEPPGVVRAYDVRSGELVWAWDPGNPNTRKRPPAGETYTRGTPNVWSAMSYDAKLGLVYLPTGNATPDFFGGQRTEFDDKWSSSIVAIDVKTGQVRWHFQTTHHDLWDFDLPAQPLLYDVPDDKGGTQPALAQVTKQGEIFLLNRETGVPIARVEERPVPQGKVPGERYSPTQPFSVDMPSIGNKTLTESDMWGATPFDQLMCRIQFKGMRHEGVYTPPGMDRALQFPGSLGGMNWGSVSVDPNTSYMFVNDMRAGLGQLHDPPRQDQSRGQRYRNGRRAAGRHTVRRHARALPLGGRHSVPETTVRHHVGHRPQDPQTDVASPGRHRTGHRPAGHPHAPADPDRHADPRRIARHPVGPAVLRRHPGLLPARLRHRQRQRNLEIALAGGQPVRADDLRFTENRQTVHPADGGRCASVDGSWGLCDCLRSA